MASSLPTATPRNAAVLPGSLLALKALWQQAADSLPAGAILVLLPESDSPQRRALEATALLLHASGHHVTTIPAELFERTNAVQGRFALP